jgi:hypothetical protein
MSNPAPGAATEVSSAPAGHPRGVRRLAEAIEPYEKLLKFVLLFGGVVYGTLFLVRTWDLPVAAFTLRVTERTAYRSGETMIIQAALTVGDGSNLRIDSLKTGCTVLDGGRRCAEADCAFAVASLVNGVLPRKEAVSWACRYDVPAEACVQVFQRVYGHAVGLRARDSHWWTNIIHCKGGEK